MELHGFTSCLYCLHDRLHPGSVYNMAYYILPLFITGLITSCLDRLHVPLHAPESITCSRIHYMLPNPLHATSVHRCQSMGSGPGHQRRRSDRRVTRLARPARARAVNSPSSVGFNLKDNIPACSDRTCSIEMRWLPARGPCTIEVEQCRWWLGQVVLGISRMSLLNFHAILPLTKI